MPVEVSGFGQPADSPIARSAGWLTTGVAALMKEPVFARMLEDPFARFFAEALSPTAPARLAELEDAEARRAFVREVERQQPGLVGVCLYRKVWFGDRVRSVLARGATQLVVLGAGCDTLAVRLADKGQRPRVFEIDRLEVCAFREEVLGRLPLDLSHVEQVGVDFDVTDFRAALREAGFDPRAGTVFVAEGVLEYLDPDEVDKIFEFARSESGPGTSLVHSFTEPVAGRQDLAVSHRRQLPGEPRRFELVPGEIGEWLRARGHSLLELTTAQDIDRDMLKTVVAPPGVPKLAVTPFQHFAVAAPQR